MEHEPLPTQEPPDDEEEFKGWVMYLMDHSPRELVVRLLDLQQTAEANRPTEDGLQIAILIIRMCILNKECPDLATRYPMLDFGLA
jgi:hypothetical protein